MDQWEELKGRLRETLKEIEMKREGGMGKKTGWWDKECKEMKREVRGKLRDWRRRGEGEREYRKGKR